MKKLLVSSIKEIKVLGASLGKKQIWSEWSPYKVHTFLSENHRVFM